MKFYHIDSSGLWKPGDRIHASLEWSSDPSSNFFIRLACKAAFPNGVCAFGSRILSRNTSPAAFLCTFVEWIYEDVRCAAFPSMPSRFSCLFASMRLEDCRAWAERIGVDYDSCQILEVESDIAVIADASYLDSKDVDMDIPSDDASFLHHLPPDFPARMACLARRYWETAVPQEQVPALLSSNQMHFLKPEALLLSPVRVLRKVHP